MLKEIIKRPYYYFFTSFFIILIIVSITSIIGYRFLQQKEQEHNWFQRQFISLSHSVFIKPTYIIDDFLNLFQFSLISQGTKVQQLTTEYVQLKNAYALLEQENKLLAENMKYHPMKQKIIATARVLSDANSLGSAIIMISAGKNDLVELGDIVTTTDGMVGKIVEIYPDTAIVLPIRHLSTKTIGRISSQGSIVLISGRHLKGGLVEYISDHVNLKAGQEIITMSNGQSMPSGIKIGTIIDPTERPIRVKLAVDFERLDYVTIVRNISKDREIIDTQAPFLSIDTADNKSENIN